METQTQTGLLMDMPQAQVKAKPAAQPVPKSARAHQRYYTADGTLVPGVTTVLGILNKPALVKWANNLGLQGIDSSKFVDDKAKIGTLAHNIIEAYLKGEDPDYSEYTKAQIDQAENSALSYFEWERHRDVKPVLTEAQLVSEEFGYGGTCDCVAMVDGELTLLDFKTGKGIYDEHLYQLAAYKQLVSEAGFEVRSCRVLRIGRDADEGFEERRVSDLSMQFGLFLHCLAIYGMQRAIAKGGK